MLLDDEAGAPPRRAAFLRIGGGVMALMKAHSNSAGSAISRNHANSTVIRMLSGERGLGAGAAAQAPTWIAGGGSLHQLGVCVVLLISTLSAMRLLYQFMKIEIDRLTVNLPMMMRMRWPARSMRFSVVVLTTDTMSG